MGHNVAVVTPEDVDWLIGHLQVVVATSSAVWAGRGMAMVDRLTQAGLVRRTLDPRDRRRVQLTLTARAEPIIGDTDPDTARRLHAVLNGMCPLTRRHLIDMLIDAIRRSAK